MKSRALKFKLLCGLQGCIPLDPTDLSEVGSAAEFIDIIDKFRVGIRKFNDRNPMITWNPVPPLKEDTTLNDIIHDIVNSRKFMNFPNVYPNDYEQVFELNFATETITLYKMRSGEYELGELQELGSMHINTIFSNWKDVFYFDASEDDEIVVYGPEDEEDEGWIPAEEESLYDYMKPKMAEALDTKEFELWDMLFTTETMDVATEVMTGEPLQEGTYITIAYSGSGDSGDIDHISVYRKTDSSPEFLGDVSKMFTKEDCDKFYSQVWRTIDEREGGFVNNDGGYGHMTISHTRFEWDHWNNVIETDHTVGIYHNFEEEDSVEEDMKITVMHLPESVEEALSAKAPESKPEITLGDIVKEHHPAIYKSGSDHDIDLRLPF